MSHKNNFLVGSSLLTVVLLFNACAFTVKTRQTNTHLFKNQKDFNSRVETVRKARIDHSDITKAQVFEILKISEAEFEQLDGKDVAEFYFSGVEPHPETAEEAIKIAELLSTVDVYMLPYKNTKTTGKITFSPKFRTEKTGYNLQLKMAFRNNKLVKLKVPGDPTIHEKRMKNVLLKFLDDLVTEEGPKNAGKAAFSPLL